MKSVMKIAASAAVAPYPILLVISGLILGDNSFRTVSITSESSVLNPIETMTSTKKMPNKYRLPSEPGTTSMGIIPIIHPASSS